MDMLRALDSISTASCISLEYAKAAEHAALYIRIVEQCLAGNLSTEEIAQRLKHYKLTGNRE